MTLRHRAQHPARGLRAGQQERLPTVGACGGAALRARTGERPSFRPETAR
jgi:hypothetical protein